MGWKGEDSSDDDNSIERPPRITKRKLKHVCPIDTVAPKLRLVNAVLPMCPVETLAPTLRPFNAVPPKLHPVNTPERGEVVIATIKDINHPALHYGNICKAVIVFGLIQGFQKSKI